MDSRSLFSSAQMPPQNGSGNMNARRGHISGSKTEAGKTIPIMAILSYASYRYGAVTTGCLGPERSNLAKAGIRNIQGGQARRHIREEELSPFALPPFVCPLRSFRSLPFHT